MATTNSINANSAGIVKYNGTGTFSGETTTQYNTLVGGASNGITNISPGITGQVLTSNGAGANPSYQTLSAQDGVVIQIATASSTTNGSTTSAITADTSIPQNTEGAEFITVSITPTNSSNALVIEFSCMVGISSATGQTIAFGLFQDSTANALCAEAVTCESTGYAQRLKLNYIMTAGTTSSTTFKIRFGRQAAGTVYINRRGTETNSFGDINTATFIVTEVEV